MRCRRVRKLNMIDDAHTLLSGMPSRAITAALVARPCRSKESHPVPAVEFVLTRPLWAAGPCA